MVSADDIRRRVQEADQKKIQERADSAAAVAETINDLAAAEAALASSREKVAEAITDAQRVMNLAELAQFTATSVPKLTTWSKPPRARSRRKPQRTEPAAETKQTTAGG